nr:isochorismatase family protein [Gordonia sp. SID5947]
MGPGRRPAVLAIDLAMAYLDDSSPLRAPVEDAVETAAVLIDTGRRAGVPVVFTRVSYLPGGADGGLFRRKIPSLKVFEEGSALADFVPACRPRPDDTVVTKQYASAFFGTSLASTLTAQGIDTLYICGLSTSGCVRASATDALQHGFRPLIVADACGDREASLHDANLLDLQAKYADVIGIDDAVSWLTGSADSSS